jgi:hypothetical protein
MIDIHQITSSTQIAAAVALVASLLIVILLKPKSRK